MQSHFTWDIKINLPILLNVQTDRFASQFSVCHTRQMYRSIFYCIFKPEADKTNIYKICFQRTNNRVVSNYRSPHVN